MKNLIDLYKSLQASVGMTSDSEGFVSTILPGSTSSKPFMIDGKQLVNPIPHQLQQPDWTNRIGFHPFLQKVQEGESRVVDKFRDRMNAYSDFMTGMLLINLAKLSCEKEKHQALSPSQARCLGPFSDADEKFVKFLTSMVQAGRANKKGLEFVRFTLIKGRVFQGKKRSRVAVMHFPLYEALPKDGKGTTVLNHKLRGIDVKMLQKIYEFLFPGIGTDGAWECASDSLTAASMEALMTLYARYVNAHNGMVQVLDKQIADNDDLLIVNDWQEEITKISDYLPEIRKIPWLEGASSKHIEVPVGSQEIRAPAVAAVNHVPVLPANAPVTQLVQQQPENKPHIKFKLGVTPNLAADSPQHQISNQQAQAHAPYNHRTQTGGSLWNDPQPQQQVQQVQQYHQPAPVVQPQYQQPIQPQVPQAQKVPETARLFNGQLYIPAQTTGISAPPVGALIIEDRLYVPLNQTPMAGVPQAQMLAMQQRPVVPGMMPQQQQITDPAQVPGLSPDEINYYRSNPVVWNNYLAHMQQGMAMQMQQNQLARHNTIPRYLQRAQERAQQQAQQQATQRTFFGQ